jgi:hypothetical protein
MTTPEDLFGSGSGGGKFPKVEELEGKLVLLKPYVIEQVPKPKDFGGKPGEMKDRLTADCIVFNDEDGSYEVYEEMYFSQSSFVSAGRKHLKPGAKPFIIGRIGKVPSKIGKEQGFDTPEKIEAGLAEHFRTKGKAPKPNFAWGMNDVSRDEMLMAFKYVLDTSPMAAASE